VRALGGPLGVVAAAWLVAACLPPYEYVADESASTSAAGTATTAATTSAAATSTAATTASSGANTTSTSSESGSGGGGAGGGTSTGDATASGGGAGGDAVVGPLGPAGEGPYGRAQLYFGAPELEEIEWPEQLELHAMVSPDGLRLTRRWHPHEDGGRVAEHVRPGLTSVWSTIDLEHSIRFELHSHLTPNSLDIFSCHGGDQKCVIHSRADVVSPFTIAVYFQDTPWFDGDAEDFCFVPTPDLRHLAFCSDRVSAEDDTATNGAQRLWIARSVDPGDLGAGYEMPELVDVEGFPDDMGPTWFDDEGLTIVFQSNRGVTSDIYVVSRASLDAPFGEPVRIDVLSDDVEEDYFFTMPSLEVLRAQPAGQGYAYFQRARSFLRVPVCVGAPCR
jgi:hypothetical protein